jgi:hypothetical protein
MKFSKLSVYSSIIINIIAIVFIGLLDVINLKTSVIQDHQTNVGYIILCLGFISLFFLAREILDLIIISKSIGNEINISIFNITGIFISCILTFTLLYYGLFLIDSTNYYLSNDKTFTPQRPNYFIWMYSNVFFFTFYSNFTLTLGDMYPIKFFSKFILMLQLMFTIIISLFFVNKIVDVDIKYMEKNKNKILQKMKIKLQK